MRIRACLIWLCFTYILLACETADRKGKLYKQEQARRNTSFSGKELSLKHCQSCHLYPGPDILDKHTWERSVLPLMGRLFGVYESNVPRSKILEGAIDKQSVLSRNIFPEKQLIDNESWQKIVDYYVSSAPDSLPRLKTTGPISAFLEQFEIISPSYTTKTELTTIVQIGEGDSNIYVGGSKGNSGLLMVLNKDFQRIDEIALPSPPVDVSVNIDRLAVTLVGSLRLSPSNNPFGQLLHIYRPAGEKKYTSFNSFLDKLRRPLQTIFDDIDGDGNDDILIADFGYYTGAVNLYRYVKQKSTYKKTILKDAPAVRMCVKDLNGDGRKDIAVLFSQGDEGISIFYNTGNGNFSEDRILRFSPSYGSVYFELADMNNDGHLDILYCNGDNGDYPPILKDYHGIRIFENDGSNNFSQVYFFPMHGAYKCSAADFDLDGDLEIVGISYFPDAQADPRQDFVYLKNEGDYSFSPQYFRNPIPARWLTFDIADLDGNGNKDILIGTGGSYRDSQSRGRTSANVPSLLFLKNLGK